MVFAKDEHPVGAFGADGAYEAFGDGVHPRGLRRGEQGFDDECGVRDKREERAAAGDRWLDEGWVIATEKGDAVNPRNDWAEWKDLLRETGLRDGRLPDARHTAATLLLRAGIVERTTQSLTGWGDTRIAQRYQHVTGVIQRDAASRVGTLLWGGEDWP
ncbi:tyrosine-type recombinase/integrase [Catenulispora sp. NL8]|uniref:Tyrosine-type recombinase/integrase n=1 Tax=Catenulispora pinistramenti TaxID=2705254 RepID=A0ABS5L0I4_9ACTN|nr:tyrosine-type recombinase/integrase [Catenulispora pinistramenti]MBS2551806.1 tyrosine-type recombinase/integrase [Catenulispora pinistramenti]